MILEELGERTCLGDINASIIPACEVLRLVSYELDIFLGPMELSLLNNKVLDDVGERNCPLKSFSDESTSEEEAFQNEGIDSMMLLYLH